VHWLVVQALSTDFWPRLLLALFSGLGIMPVVLVVLFKKTRAVMRANPHWAVALVLGSVSLFGGQDKARLFLTMLPAVTLLAVMVLAPLLRRMTPGVIVWLVITGTAHLYLGHHLTPMSTFDAYLNRLVPIYGPGPMWPEYVRLVVVLGLWLAATLAVRPWIKLAKDV
jgi:hypothetical protein